MSAVATKKAGSDRAIQLTFPLEFKRAYDLPRSYFPSDDGVFPQLMIGDDFQSQYHEQKRADANRSVMDGIQARRTQQRLLMTGHANYHVPKPVLSQRKFANPMYGAEMPYSTRRDNGVGAPFKVVEVGAMEGMGVVGGARTKEGQEFYKGQLDARIAQLNRINALTQGFAVEMGAQYRTENPEKTGPFDKVKFFIFLRGLFNAVYEGDVSRFTFENLKELITMLFQFGPIATREDFEGAIKLTKDTWEGLGGLLDEDRLRTGENEDENAYTSDLRVYMEMIYKYLGQMFKNMNLQEGERRTLSNSLRKSLGFESANLVYPTTAVGSDAATISSRGTTRTGFTGYSGFSRDSGTRGSSSSGGSDWFDRPARPREDEEAGGMPRAPFAGRSDDPERRRFGERTGAMTRGPSAWFGDEDAGTVPSLPIDLDAARDEAPRLVYPLGMAGVDPNAEGVPRADEGPYRDTVEYLIGAILRDLDGWTGQIDTTNEFVAENYPDPQNFVDDLAGQMEDQGFTKAQIARGMELISRDLGDGPNVFAEYIAENSGDTGPAPQQVARPASLAGMAGLPTAVYRDRDEDGAPDLEEAGEAAPAPAPRAAARERTPDEVRAILRAAGWPTTNAEMLERARTLDAYERLYRNFPKELGGPLTWRGATKVASPKQYIKTLMRKIMGDVWG